MKTRKRVTKEMEGLESEVMVVKKMKEMEWLEVMFVTVTPVGNWVEIKYRRHSRRMPF